jgi:hypothetical protein
LKYENKLILKKKSSPMRFRNPNQPSIPPKRDYSPTRATQKPPGYAEIEAASQLDPENTVAWSTFVCDVMRMPESYVGAVQEAIRQQRWKIAPNPMASIRTSAHQEARKMGLQ